MESTKFQRMHLWHHRLAVRDPRCTIHLEVLELWRILHAWNFEKLQPVSGPCLQNVVHHHVEEENLERISYIHRLSRQ